MPVTHLESGGKTIIGNGSVLAFEQESIELVLEHEDDDDPLVFVFNFVENGGEPDIHAKPLEQEQVGVEFKLFNHGGQLDAGPDKPISIGKMSGRELFCSYNTTTNGKDEEMTYILTYTFFLEENDDE